MKTSPIQHSCSVVSACENDFAINLMMIYSRKVARYYLARTQRADVTLPFTPLIGRPEHNEYRWVDYDEAIRINPQDAPAYAYRGLSYLSLSVDEASPNVRLSYLTQGVSDVREAEALGMVLPTALAELVEQVEGVLAESQ